MSKCVIDVFGKAIGFLLLIKSPLPPFFKAMFALIVEKNQDFP